ncbi:MAG: LysR family transcriptional regulator [Clostridia bacterium]|nr:LysR family transcriptional regulator [Clostridia bacterium]
MYRQMQYFVAVADTGSFSEAAEQCHISQSAVSQQIRALEDALGVALLHRHGRKFELTEAGRYFYLRAKRQLAETEAIVRETRGIGIGEVQLLRVGVLTGFSARIMHSAAAEFTAAHPNVRLSLVTGTHENIFTRVLAGQLDLLINDQRRALADHFVNEPLGEQPIYALVRENSDMGRARALSISALTNEVCILVSEAEQRENEADFWRNIATLQSGILFTGSVEEALLNATAGVGYFPCDRDMPADSTLARVPLYRGDSPLTRRMFAFWPKSGDSALQRAFAEAVKRHFV